MRGQKISAALLAASLLATLTACNEEKAQVIEQDWIHHPPGSDVQPQQPTPTDVTGLYTGPKSVAQFVQKFVDDAKLQGVDVLPDMEGPKLEIRIASLNSYGSSVIGLCETGRMRRVTFDPDFWNSVSDRQKEILAHHELGHCVLYRGHRSTLLESGAYASVMYPIIMTPKVYDANYDYYQQELFSQNALEAVDPNASMTHICSPADAL